MWTIKIKYLIILFVLLTVSVRGQNVAPKQRTIVLSNPDKPYELNVNVYEGKIQITGYDGKSIVMESDSKVPIHTDEKDNRVTINTELTHEKVILKIKIPRNKVALKLGIFDKGAIEVTDVSGEIDMANVNGGIICNGISGSALATTVNGDIQVKFKSVAPNMPMAFSTLTGNIDITYPADTHASIRLRSDNGKIHSDFNSTPQPGTPSGNREWQYIKINGGGAETMIKSMAGNIFLRKAQ